MRGKKTAPELVEEARSLYLVKDSVSEVARTLGLPRKTVAGLIQKDDEFAELRRQQKRELILLANQKAKEVLSQIDPTKAKSLTELSITFGTLIDKNSVLSGEQFKSGVNVNVGDNRRMIFNVSPSLAKVIERIKT